MFIPTWSGAGLDVEVSHVMVYRCPLIRSCELASATGLDGIDLSLCPCEPSESLGELIAVEKLALGWLDRAQRGTR